MIILDTQVVRGMSFDSAEARLVRVIRTSGEDRVALPWMAFEERLAQYVLAYEEAHRKAESAHREVSRRLPPSVEVAAPTFQSPTEARKLWDARLRELVEVMPTSGEILQEALKREANGQRPANKKGDTKTGARDVAIWLTAVEYAHAHPDETVYFISGNTKDFTDGKGSYPAPMDADREYAGSNFVHLTELSEVLEQLAPAVPVQPEDVKARLRSSSGSIQRAALREWGGYSVMLNSPLAALWRKSGEVERVRFILSGRAKIPFMSAKLVDVSEIKAYRLGDDTWCTARMTWRLIAPAVQEHPAPGYAGGLDLACCVFTSHVLLPLTEGGGPLPQLFDIGRPEVPQTRDDIDWPETASQDKREFLNAIRAHDAELGVMPRPIRGEAREALTSDQVAPVWWLTQSSPSTLADASLAWTPLYANARQDKAELDVELGELETEFDDLGPDEREAAIDAARAESYEEYEQPGSDPEENSPEG
ncbi:PIN domain-containing protein [Streptomyces globisporus]